MLTLGKHCKTYRLQVCGQTDLAELLRAYSVPDYTALIVDKDIDVGFHYAQAV